MASRYPSAAAPILRTITPRSNTLIQPSSCTAQQVRYATPSANAAKYKRADASLKKKVKRKGNTHFVLPDLKQTEQFALCDAMRYIRAFEVGRAPSSSKYELALRMKTLKNGPVLRNRFRLPHPVNTDLRICVIADPESKAGQAAKAAGAVLVGEEPVFEAIREGRIEFERCLCHQDSLQKLSKSGVARILGPRGLMPSTKMGTVTKDAAAAVRDMVGGTEYRERTGVIRMAIGQLGFTPEEMQRNIKSFMDMVKKDCQAMSDRISKEVHEVVLSSTNAPGFTLNGAFRSEQSVPTAALSTL